jgi:hypothetical protein
VNNALDRLEQKAHYLHFASTGVEKRYWFHTKPNLNILINEAQSEVRKEEVHGEVLQRLKKLEPTIRSFPKLIIGVQDASMVPELQTRTLAILGLEHVGSIAEPSKTTKAFIESLATKRGEQARVNRNALVFLSANDQGYAALRTKVSEYLACGKLLNELTTLEADQRNDLEKRRREAEAGIPAALASTFTLVSRFNSREGVRTLPIGSIRSNLTDQLNTSLREQMMEEEWLLQGIGLNLMKRHGLMPEPGQPISVKVISNAFIQFDDKPQLDAPEVVLDAIQKYCLGGSIAVGMGSPGAFSKVFFEERVPHLDLHTEDWYVLDPADVPPSAHPSDATTAPDTHTKVVPAPSGSPISATPTIPEKDTSQLMSMNISGEVRSQDFTQLFQSFLYPMNQKGLKPKIRVTIEAEVGGIPLRENDPEVKAMMESARQLGISFIIMKQ